MNGILPSIRRRLTSALAPPTTKFVPLVVDRAIVGRLTPARAARLARRADVFAATADALAFCPRLASLDARTAAVADVVRELAAEGALSAWRDEAYAVAVDRHVPPAFLLERAAARYFGIRTWAAHVNGFVAAGPEPRLWFARRAPGKPIEPDRLDNLVAGGITAGATVAATVVKEAWEEAGIAAPLAATARPAGVVHVCREHADGLQLETIYVHDLALPTEFVPRPQDGEAVEHRCVPFAEAARLIAQDNGRDVVTADASLVVVDFLLRHGALDPDAPEYLDLEGLRHASLPG
jgi:8-oxo-dGTP pyrophosphatase MutT (NUDIX family)